MTSPKPDSCKLARGRPCASCLELENFDREAESILERRSEDRQKILAKINRRHDPFIQRLPLELASQIFAFCIPPQDPGDDPRYIPLIWDETECRYIKPFNIILGAICQAWRQVAWSTPKLWCTLPILLHRCGNSAHKDLVLEWLGRSAQSPLDVFLVGTSVSLTKRDIDMWKPLIDIANGCSSRWRSFNTYASEFVLGYITGDGQGTCILECLRVGPGEAGLYQRSSHWFSLTNVIPVPSQLFSTAMPPRLIDIDWSNLITIEIGDIYVNEILVLLQWVPRMTRCKLHDLQDGQDEHLPPPMPAHHHALQNLYIGIPYRKQTAAQLLDLLTLPLLISLSFDSIYNPLQNVAAFLDRSACRLTTLYDLNGSLHRLLELAPRLQALERLGYPGYFGSNTIQREKKLNHNFLPNLREILVHSGDVSWWLVVDLIMTCPPKTISIHVKHPDPEDGDFLIDEESARRFQDLIKNGYNIEITCRCRGETKNRDLLAWSVEIRM